MTPLVDAKTCLAHTLIKKKTREIILSSATLLASFAILTSLASALQCGSNPAHLTFDSIYSGGQSQRTYYSQNGGAVAGTKERNPNCGLESPATPGNKPGEDSKSQPPEKRSWGPKPADFNRDIYYKNKLEFSLDGGWLPINVPFPFDVFEGDAYILYPLHYTLVPIIASLRWHIDNVGSPWILRGNWDLTCSGSATAIPRR